MKDNCSVDRRTFLKHLSVLGGAGVVFSISKSHAKSVLGTTRSFLSGGPRVMLDKVTESDFSELLNQKFRLYLDSGKALPVELIETTNLASKTQETRGPNNRDPFSIVFRGPKDAGLPQRIYKIEHKKVGKLDLFLVPIGPDDKGMRYEAIFT